MVFCLFMHINYGNINPVSASGYTSHIGDFAFRALRKVIAFGTDGGTTEMEDY